MEEQEQFLEILGEIRAIAASQDNKLTRKEIKQYLSHMELNDVKLDAVCRYLAAMDINIDGMPESGRQDKYENLQAAGSDAPDNLIKDFLMGEASARNRLAESKLSYVAELASGYKKREAVKKQIISMEEIIAEGNAGLLMGISVIEQDKAQYIKNNGEPDYETVNGIINMEIINAMESMIDMASEDKDWENAVLAKVNLLHEAARYLAEEYGRMPSEEELSAYTKVSAEEINNIMNLSNDAKKVLSFKKQYL